MHDVVPELRIIDALDEHVRRQVAVDPARRSRGQDARHSRATRFLEQPRVVDDVVPGQCGRPHVHRPPGDQLGIERAVGHRRARGRARAATRARARCRPRSRRGRGSRSGSARCLRRPRRVRRPFVLGMAEPPADDPRRAELGRRAARVAQRGRARSRQQRREHQHPCGTLREPRHDARRAGATNRPHASPSAAAAAVSRSRSPSRSSRPTSSAVGRPAARRSASNPSTAGLDPTPARSTRRAWRRAPGTASIPERNGVTATEIPAPSRLSTRPSTRARRRRVERAGEHDAARSCARGRVAGPVLAHRRADAGAARARRRAASGADPRTAARRATRTRAHRPTGRSAPEPGPRRARSATTRAPSGSASVAVERDDHRRSVARAATRRPARPRRGRASRRRRARGRGSSPRSRGTGGSAAGRARRNRAAGSGVGDARLDVAAHEPVHEPPHPVGVGERLAARGTRTTGRRGNGGRPCSRGGLPAAPIGRKGSCTCAPGSTSTRPLATSTGRREPRTRRAGARRTAPRIGRRCGRDGARAACASASPFGVHAVARARRELGDLGRDAGHASGASRELPLESFAGALVDDQALGHDEPRLRAGITHAAPLARSSAASDQRTA